MDTPPDEAPRKIRKEGGEKPRGDRPPPIQEMLSKLNLTQEQRDLLRPVLEGHREAMRELQQDKDLTRAEKMEQRTALVEKLNTDLAGVLTPAQMEQFAELQRLAKERRSKRDGEGRPDRPGKGKQGPDAQDDVPKEG
jgi:Spy/CpxP family protein refolding chaperone